jgi:hypothetical protein
MAASPSVVALPWYARGDYPALLKLFSDPDKLPATYDAWLERAEGVERQFKGCGCRNCYPDGQSPSSQVNF